MYTMITFIGKRRGRWRCGANLSLSTEGLSRGEWGGCIPVTRAWCVGMGAELKTTAKRTPGSRACGQRAGNPAKVDLQGCQTRTRRGALRLTGETGETGEASSSEGCECDPGYQSEPRRNGAWLQDRIWPSNAPFSSLGASRVPSAPPPVVRGSETCPRHREIGNSHRQKEGCHNSYRQL